MKSAGQKNTTVFSLLFIFCFPCYKNTPGFGFIFFIWLNLLYIKRTNITICAFCQCRHYKSLHAYLHIPYVCLFDWEEPHTWDCIQNFTYFYSVGEVFHAYVCTFCKYLCVTLFLEVVFLWVWSWYLYIHNTKTV